MEFWGKFLGTGLQLFTKRKTTCFAVQQIKT